MDGRSAHQSSFAFDLRGAAGFTAVIRRLHEHLRGGQKRCGAAASGAAARWAQGGRFIERSPVKVGQPPAPRECSIEHPAVVTWHERRAQRHVVRRLPLRQWRWRRCRSVVGHRGDDHRDRCNAEVWGHPELTNSG